MFSYLEQLVKYACYLQTKQQHPIFLHYFTASLLHDCCKNRIDSSTNDQKSFLPENNFVCRKLHEQLNWGTAFTAQIVTYWKKKIWRLGNYCKNISLFGQPLERWQQMHEFSFSNWFFWVKVNEIFFFIKYTRTCRKLQFLNKLRLNIHNFMDNSS